MDNLLNKRPISLTESVVNLQEECAVSGEYTLPEYCPDVAAMLKCIMEPHIQNRQQSGDQLLLDGEVCVRVLYLDEERKGVRCVEFSLPFSCCVRGIAGEESAISSIHIAAKYANCRAVTPRRIEVRGAITVAVKADAVVTKEIAMPVDGDDLFCKCQQMTYTKTVGSAERILTVNETLSFPEGLPAAEMLLGGDCRSVIRECKLLNGKAIIKGEVYVHQLYTDNVTAGNTHCLNYVLPFSQILDVDGVQEGQRYAAQVLVLSDTERCSVGPDGAANVLEFSCKLLVRLQVYQPETATVLLDAYHTRCPMDTECEEVRACEHRGMSFEQAVLPLQLELPERNLQEIVDIWVCPQMLTAYCEKGLAHINGRLLISLLYRDGEGCVCFYEQAEEYHLEYPCCCDEISVDVRVTDLRYRIVENKLELQVGVWVCLQGVTTTSYRAVCTARLHTDNPYPSCRATALVYYADAGEDLWDVGRRCHASPDKICQENGLDCDTLDKSAVLIVPMV